MGAKYMLGNDVKDTSLFELSGGGLAASADEPKAAAPVAAQPGAQSKEDKVKKPKEKKTASGGGLTMDEVAKHTTKEDCWVVLHNRVLNVTSFLSQHPGGELAILTFAGKDATAEFDMIHPPDVIEKYAPNAVIGMLGGAPDQVDMEAGGGGGSGGSKKAILVAPARTEKPKENCCMRCFHGTKWHIKMLDRVTWSQILFITVFGALMYISATQ